MTDKPKKKIHPNSLANLKLASRLVRNTYMLHPTHLRTFVNKLIKKFHPHKRGMNIAYYRYLEGHLREKIVMDVKMLPKKGKWMGRP